MWLAKVTYSDNTTEEVPWTDALSKECKPVYTDMEFNQKTGYVVMPIVTGFEFKGKPINCINFTQDDS